jgi:ABC-type proline/glycine betaine transport system ATPase subunit
VMRDGRIVQVATPEELWAGPADAWVARFVGLANVTEDGATATVVRPEGVSFRPDPRGEAVVGGMRRDGPLVTLSARYDDGREIVSAETGLTPPAPGTRVAVEIDQAAVVQIPASAS